MWICWDFPVDKTILSALIWPDKSDPLEVERSRKRKGVWATQGGVGWSAGTQGGVSWSAGEAESWISSNVLQQHVDLGTQPLKEMETFVCFLAALAALYLTLCAWPPH